MQILIDWISWTSITGIISHGAPIASIHFLPTTHAKTNANKMCSQFLHNHVSFHTCYHHAQNTAGAGDIRT